MINKSPLKTLLFAGESESSTDWLEIHWLYAILRFAFRVANTPFCRFCQSLAAGRIPQCIVIVLALRLWFSIQCRVSHQKTKYQIPKQPELTWNKRVRQPNIHQTGLRILQPHKDYVFISKVIVIMNIIIMSLKKNTQ